MCTQSEQDVTNDARSLVRNCGLATVCGLAFCWFASAAHGQCLIGDLTGADSGQGDSFGYTLAISGDTAIVSALGDDTPGGTNAGSAYIFVHAGGAWTQQAQLLASDGAASDQFGYDVAIDGDTAIVGADWDDTLAGINAGSAYVFVRAANGVWTQQAKLVATDSSAFDLFGVSVAVSGDTAVVGAPGDNTLAGTDAGSAYVFVRDNEGVWTQQARLFASDGAAGDFFSGYAVAIDGDTVVVGAINDDTQAGTDAGSAYVFVRDGNGVWSEQAHVFASDSAAFDYFGSIVAISGDTIIAGADEDDTQGGTDAGSAYVFVRNEDTWTEEAHLFAPESDADADDHFGWFVDISGDTAVVGAPTIPQFGGDPELGSVYAFQRVGAIWTQKAHVFAPAGAVGDVFGFSVAVSGATAVAAPGFNNVMAASAYAFDLGCTPGDLNCDNAVTVADVPHFIDALISPGSFTGCDIMRADMNADSLNDGRDTAAFAAALVGE